MENLLKHKEKILIFLILIIASFLRLYKIDEYMTFLGDEGRDAMVVKDIVDSVPFFLAGNFSEGLERLTLLGPTASVGGFFLGPIYYYFMAPFLFLFNYSPVGPAVMVALFGVATVWLVYKVGKEFFNKTAALVAASLFAMSPLVIVYSKSSWNPNLMPFFTLLTLYCLYKAVQKNKAILFVFCGILLGILMQLHYLAIFVGVIIACYIFLGELQREKIKKFSILKLTTYLYIFLLLGFIIGWSPFLAFEIRHDFLNIQNILNFVFNPQGKDAISTNAGFFGNIYNVFFRLFGRLVTSFPPLEQVSLRESINIFIWYIGSIILGLGSLFLFIYQYIREKNREKKLQLSLILFWTTVGIGLFGFYRKNIYDYYLGFMFVLPFLLVGNTLSFLYGTKIKQLKFYSVGRVFSIIIFIALSLLSIYKTPLQSIPNNQLSQAEIIAKFVLEKTNSEPYNFGLITGGNSDHAYRYFFEINKRPPVLIDTFEHDPKRKSVTDQLLVVCEINPCSPLGNSIWEIAGFGRAEIAQEWNVSVLKVYRLIHYKEK